jgi:hypothetical protein
MGVYLNLLVILNLFQDLIIISLLSYINLLLLTANNTPTNPNSAAAAIISPLIF